MAFTALEKKLSLGLVVLEFMNLYHFLDGSGTNSLCPGWVGSAAIRLAFLWSLPAYIESRSGSGLPTIRWAVFTKSFLS